MYRLCLVAAAAVVLLSLGASQSRPVFAADSTLTTGPIDKRVEALAKIQPGLGTVMIEYGNRFVDVYFAARGGNWGLAQYQLKEMIEIQEVGETTRPQRASSLKAFEDGYLKSLAKAIENKDWTAFGKLYSDTVDGCNACHAATGHAFIRFKLPFRPVEDYIDFSYKTDPKKEGK